MNEVFLKILNRINDLGYDPEIYFPEIKKISNLIKNKQINLISKYVLSCARRAYELGIVDNLLDSLLDELYHLSVNQLGK